MLASFCALVLARPSATAPDRDARDVYSKMIAKLSKASDASATMVIHEKEGVTEYGLKLKRKNRISMSAGMYEIHCDGRTFMIYTPAKHEVAKDSADKGAAMITQTLIGLEEIVGAKPRYKVSGKARSENYMSKPAYALTLEGLKGQPIMMFFRHMTLYVDASTFLPLGFKEDEDPKTRYFYKNLVVGNSMTDDAFAWQPPSDAKVVGMPRY